MAMVITRYLRAPSFRKRLLPMPAEVGISTALSSSSARRRVWRWPVIHAQDGQIETVEGLSRDGTLFALQESFLRHGAAQCGICTPGMLMAATALLRQNPAPSRQEVEAAFGGVLCRCTGYAKIVTAVMDTSIAAPTPAPVAGAAVGARLPWLDGRPKVVGSEIYGADCAPANALLVLAVRSPHAAAQFSLGDIAGWIAAQSGKVQAFTAADIPGENRFGVIPAFADQPALADTHVRMRGAAVAIVAGAPDLIEPLDLTDFPVTWDVTESLIDTQTARKKNADLVHAERDGNILITGKVRCGDPQQAIAGSVHVAEIDIETS